MGRSFRRQFESWQVTSCYEQRLGDQNIPYIVDESVAVGEIEVSLSSQVDL